MTKLRKNISQFALLYVAGAGVLVFLILSFIRKRAEKADTSQIVNPIVTPTKTKKPPVTDNEILKKEILELSGIKDSRYARLKREGRLVTLRMISGRTAPIAVHDLPQVIELCKELGVEAPTPEALIELRNTLYKE